MEMNWNYVWAALAIHFLLVTIVPRLIKKPTGVQVVDDIVLYLNSTHGFLLSSSILLALTVYGAWYWVESAETGSIGESPSKF